LPRSFCNAARSECPFLSDAKTSYRVSFKFKVLFLAWKLLLKGQDKTKEEGTMKTREAARKGAYIGAGVGLVLFAIIGFLPGSFLGGVVGLNIAGGIFGFPLSSALLPRIIVGISMLLGIFVSALIFIMGSSIGGWLIGYVIDSLRAGKPVEAEAKR
jgi:hypothetical protein